MTNYFILKKLLPSESNGNECFKHLVLLFPQILLRVEGTSLSVTMKLKPSTGENATALRIGRKTFYSKQNIIDKLMEFWNLFSEQFLMKVELLLLDTKCI